MALVRGGVLLRSVVMPSGDDSTPADPLGSSSEAPVRSEAQLTGSDGSRRHLGGEVTGHLAPAWRRVTQGEARWPVTIAIVTAVVLQLVLPRRYAPGPPWLLPVMEVVMLVGLVAANPVRFERHSLQLRGLSLLMIAAVTFANVWSAARLVDRIVQGDSSKASVLLLSGGAIWLTNVVVFSLWYWEFDRGGPFARSQAHRQHPDFVFAQMQTPDLAAPDWEPTYVDYLYLSFTNATAFSPTDTLPLTRWAKLTMMAQSAVSLVTVALVVARAINILPSPS